MQSADVALSATSVRASPIGRPLQRDSQLDVRQDTDMQQLRRLLRHLPPNCQLRSLNDILLAASRKPLVEPGFKPISVTFVDGIGIDLGNIPVPLISPLKHYILWTIHNEV